MKNLSTKELYKVACLAKACGNSLKPIYDDCVREIRRRRRPVGDDVLVKAFGDTSWIIRTPLGEIPDRGTAEIIAEALRYERPNSPYDCTGQVFTRWQEVHFLGGQWWLWQHNSMDV